MLGSSRIRQMIRESEREKERERENTERKKNICKLSTTVTQRTKRAEKGFVLS